jgi:hypothetical protein
MPAYNNPFEYDQAATFAPGFVHDVFIEDHNYTRLGLSPGLRQTVKTLLTVRCKFIVPDPGTDLGWACR